MHMQLSYISYGIYLLLIQVKGCGEASCDSLFSSPIQGYMLGVLSACLSALAGVYTEFLMKKNNDSLYWQNVQLYTQVPYFFELKQLIVTYPKTEIIRLCSMHTHTRIKYCMPQCFRDSAMRIGYGCGCSLVGSKIVRIRTKCGVIMLHHNHTIVVSRRHRYFSKNEGQGNIVFTISFEETYLIFIYLLILIDLRRDCLFTMKLLIQMMFKLI